jgi:hypothetical protein
MGAARDVRVDCHTTDSKTNKNGKMRIAQDQLEVTISNDKPVPIAFEFKQALYTGDTRIVTESMAHTMKPGGAVWTFALAAGEHTTLRYAVEYPD